MHKFSGILNSRVFEIPRGGSIRRGFLNSPCNAAENKDFARKRNFRDQPKLPAGRRKL